MSVATARRPGTDADRARIVAAIVAVAGGVGGDVDPNRVREALTVAGVLSVPSQLVGQVYHQLKADRALIPAGTVTSTDRAGGNAGKQVPKYQLARVPRDLLTVPAQTRPGRTTPAHLRAVWDTATPTPSPYRCDVCGGPLDPFWPQQVGLSTHPICDPHDRQES